MKKKKKYKRRLFLGLEHTTCADPNAIKKRKKKKETQGTKNKRPKLHGSPVAYVYGNASVTQLSLSSTYLLPL